MLRRGVRASKAIVLVVNGDVRAEGVPGQLHRLTSARMGIKSSMA
jgi:hypothetical protein